MSHKLTLPALPAPDVTLPSVTPGGGDLYRAATVRAYAARAVVERDALIGRLGSITQEIAYAEIHGWPRESQARLAEMVDALLKERREKVAA